MCSRSRSTWRPRRSTTTRRRSIAGPRSTSCFRSTSTDAAWGGGSLGKGTTMTTLQAELLEPRRSCATALARVLGGSLIAVSVAILAAAPAMADDDEEGGEGEGRWHRHKHRKHHYDHHYSEGYYYQPPVYYYQPAPVYVAPPPPVYYYPAPVYRRPEVNIVFPLDFD